ncbi:MAG: hypothetical protein DRR19_18035 [Candidatus Parabeggiatoa sp. nov. 1]|nr:MAG: hypothetical protein DRR19_18035 [Gammaproteobacteria bacterium]
MNKPFNLINTAFEFLADAVSPNYHPLIGLAKDAAAGAVLISAIGSVVIGLIVIVPYLNTQTKIYAKVDSIA